MQQKSSCTDHQTTCPLFDPFHIALSMIARVYTFSFPNLIFKRMINLISSRRIVALAADRKTVHVATYHVIQLTLYTSTAPAHRQRASFLTGLDKAYDTWDSLLANHKSATFAIGQRFHVGDARGLWWKGGGKSAVDKLLSLLHQEDESFVYAHPGPPREQRGPGENL